MNRAPKNKSKKVAKQKAIYFKSRALEDLLFALVRDNKLDESEMKTLEQFKSRYQVWSQLGEKLAKKAEFKFDFGKYYKFRESLLNKYYPQLTKQEDKKTNDLDQESL